MGVGEAIGEAGISLYRALGNRLQPLAEPFLNRRTRHGKEDPARRGERFGQTGKKRPAGPLVWAHAASVGETNAVLPLLQRLGERGLAVLLTTGTVTSAAIAERRLAASAMHQYVPLDIRQYVERFLDHWRPDLALFVESELWPAAMTALAERSVPLVLVNGRLSTRSFACWRRAGPFARALMSRIELCLAQSVDDSHRFEALGAASVTACGNLKFDAAVPSADETALQGLRDVIAGRPVFVAASTHPGEEKMLTGALNAIDLPDGGLLTIIVPRHPDRGPEIAEDTRAQDFAVALRSAGEQFGDKTRIYIADTIGEMGLWYRLATITFLGGSLIRHGGQNPIEPAKLGVPIMHGPHIGNFADVYRALDDARASVLVADQAALETALMRLLADDAERQRLAREAHACVERFTGALDRTLDALEPFLERLEQRNTGAGTDAESGGEDADRA
ncbi:MAG: 3-deoxy-D-manno-octulosonic acid transferase [Hyphomicrobiales bacterium]|nr:3-deoxy-D-manno-octulosonic acid transferase [Hyphomicrobiales bacterium]